MSFSFLAVVLALGAPPSDTWPQWRGPNRDGVIPAANWPGSLKDDSFKLDWKIEKLGPSYSGPIVSKDLVFTTETADKKTEVVTAFVRSDAPLGGLGEPCVPPLAPALANAIYAASGVRVRALPIKNTPLKRA